MLSEEEKKELEEIEEEMAYLFHPESKQEITYLHNLKLRAQYLKDKARSNCL